MIHLAIEEAEFRDLLSMATGDALPVSAVHLHPHVLRLDDVHAVEERLKQFHLQAGNE